MRSRARERCAGGQRDLAADDRVESRGAGVGTVGIEGEDAIGCVGLDVIDLVDPAVKPELDLVRTMHFVERDRELSGVLAQSVVAVGIGADYARAQADDLGMIRQVRDLPADIANRVAVEVTELDFVGAFCRGMAWVSVFASLSAATQSSPSTSSTRTTRSTR